MFVFAASGMRRRQSSSSWYFCICRYWEVYPGFWTELDELWSHSGLLLVLCPDCISVHSCMPFPEFRLFSCCPGTTTCFIVLSLCILHLSVDRSCCICFSPSFHQVEVCYYRYAKTILIPKVLRMKITKTSENCLVLVNIAHWALSHHCYLKLLF